VREGKSRRRAIIRTVVVGGVLITAAAAITLYTPWLGVFGLREIIVSGNQRVSAEEIGRAAALRSGQPILSISRSGVSSHVGTLPWIKETRVERVLPNAVRIRVVERSPVAWVRDGERCLTIGEGGIVVDESCTDRDGTFELVGASRTGDAPGARLMDSRVSELMDALRGLQIPGVEIQQIDVSDLSSVILLDESGLRILLGTIESYARRVDALVALSREVDILEYSSIDLRLEGEATLVTW
jgi:cell division protein FtsQ